MGGRPSRERRRAVGRRVVAVTIALVVLASAFGGLSVRSGPSTSTDRVGSSGEVSVAPAYVPGRGVAWVGALPGATPLSVGVAVAPSDPAGLEARLALTYTPGTPEYHQYLTPAEIADRYGASPLVYQRAVAYFEAYGLNVTTSPDRWWMEVRGPSTDVAAAFHTTFGLYQDGAREFFSHPTPATLPATVPWAGALGLGNETVLQPAVASTAGAPAPTAPSCAVGSSLHPCNLGLAYNLSSLWSVGDNGTGYRIGIVDTYDGSEPEATLASDLATFTGLYGLPSGGVDYLYPIPTSHNLNATSTGWGEEEALDLEWARAIAPGARIDMTFAPDPTTGLYGAVDWLVAHHAVDVLSLSWGEPDVGAYNTYAGACSFACNATSDGSYTLLHPVLVAAALEGIGVFVASGDCGSADGTGGYSTDYPASDPAVTGVGGTNLTLTSASGYAHEVAWSGNALGTYAPGCQNQGGSGGGYAPSPRPFWQKAPGLPTTGAHADLRGVPDVSIVGGRPAVNVVYNGVNLSLWGTSMSTPMWAGIEAVADQAHRSALGFLNPALYAIARGSAYGRAFHDVTSGSNGYLAGTGWDPVTGLGSPNASALIPLLAATPLTVSNLSVGLKASPRFGAAPLAATFYVSASRNGTAVPGASYDVDFGDGNATWTTNATVTHRYTAAGVFVARAVAFDPYGNSSVSAPIAVVVGGGVALNVTLTVSNATPAVGANVTFNVTLVGGTAPYDLTYAFGDGTYAFNQTSTTITHAFGAAGPFCAAVVASDSGSPQDGGVSPRVGIAVGGGGVPGCGNTPPLSATLATTVRAFDAPGDLPLELSVAGGAPPYTTHFVSTDPYVTACQCGIFHTPGTATVRAYVNDSVTDETVATLFVTVYPALAGNFTATPGIGTAPLAVHFTAAVSGGHNASAASTRWSFGDGTTGAGADVNHTYTNPGLYVAVANVTDGFGGEASRAFLIDALGPVGRPLAISATIGPALAVPAGTPVVFSATASGGAGGYAFRWNLSDGSSSFGPNLTETFSATGCLGAGTCPLSATLTVTDAGGNVSSAVVALPGAVLRRTSALVLNDSVPTTGGRTPYLLVAQANASGMPRASVSWAFGDGGTATGATAVHQYLVPGNYTVVEVATDPAGDRLLRTHAIAISGPPRVAPQVAGGPNATQGLVPLTVNFSASASGGAGGPYSYLWEFGDGATASGAVALHRYLRAGTFLANLTVADRIGTRSSRTYSITVFNVTAVAFDFGPVGNTTRVGGEVNGTVRVVPACGPQSVPGCAPGTVRILLGWRAAVGPANLTVFSGPPNATGVLDFQVAAPPTAGAYALYAIAVGPNFTGFASVAVTVGGPTAAALPALLPALLIGAGAAVGAACGAVAFLLGRRGRSPVVSP